MTRILVNIEDDYIECLRHVAEKHNVATGDVVRGIVEAFLEELLVPVMALGHSDKDRACSNCGGLVYHAVLKSVDSYLCAESVAEPTCRCGIPLGNEPELTMCRHWWPRNGVTPVEGVGG